MRQERELLHSELPQMGMGPVSDKRIGPGVWPGPFVSSRVQPRASSIALAVRLADVP